MASILVLYDSGTGNTRAMAEAVAEGAAVASEMTVTLRHVDEATGSDLLEHDGFAVGSPTWCGQMTWKLKRFFDESTCAWGKVEGKVGCAFSTAGGQGGGAELTCLSVLTVLLNYGLLVFGVTEYSSPQMTAHYGAVALGRPTEEELAACRLLGRKLAENVQRLSNR